MRKYGERDDRLDRWEKDEGHAEMRQPRSMIAGKINIDTLYIFLSLDLFCYSLLYMCGRLGPYVIVFSLTKLHIYIFNVYCM